MNYNFILTGQDYTIDIDDRLPFRVVFSPGTHRVPLPITIIEDDLPELDEIFQMIIITIPETPALTVQQQHTLVTIQDNDGNS